jgi:hypothetical protein
MSDLPPAAQQRHSEFVALMQGRFGQIFRAKVMEGRASHEQTRLLAYFAFYYQPSGQHEVPFLRLEDGSPTKGQAAAKVASLSLTVGEAAGTYTIVERAPSQEQYFATEQMIDQAALQQAQGFLGNQNLPIAVAAFHKATSDNSDKVIFWYPALSQPDRLWRWLAFAIKKLHLT